MRFNPTERLREHRDNYNKTGERINMAGADLSYHLFQSGDLLIEGVDMAGADLSRSTFIIAYIDGKLNETNFYFNDFINVTFLRVKETKMAMFICGYYSGCTFTDCNFKSNILKENTYKYNNFTNVTFINVTFEYNAFKMCSFDSVTFINCHFDSTNFADDTFAGCTFKGCRFNDVNFAGVDFTYSEIIYCDFRKSYFDNANLKEATLSESLFHSCVLEGLSIDMGRADDNNILFVGCGEWKEPLVAFSMEKKLPIN